MSAREVRTLKVANRTSVPVAPLPRWCRRRSARLPRPGPGEATRAKVVAAAAASARRGVDRMGEVAPCEVELRMVQPRVAPNFRQSRLRPEAALSEMNTR